MLDYQINEAISRAYSESVCGYRHKKPKSCTKNSINEDNNTVYRVQGPSLRDLDSRYMREMERKNRERRSKLSQEEREREDRIHERMFKEAQRELERQQMDVENKKHRTYMVAAPEREREKRPKATLTSQGEVKRAQMRAREYTDPGMRLGNSVYQGLEFALPVAAFGKFEKGAKAASELLKAVGTGSRAKDLAIRGLKGYGWYGAGNEIGDTLDNAGFDTAADIARSVGAAIGAKSALSPVGAKLPLNKRFMYGVPGGFGVQQGMHDISSQLEKRGIITPETKRQMDVAGDYIGLGAVGAPLWNAGEKLISKGDEKGVEHFVGGNNEQTAEENKELDDEGDNDSDNSINMGDMSLDDLEKLL